MKFLVGVEYRVAVSVDRNTLNYKMRVVGGGNDVVGSTTGTPHSTDTTQLINYAVQLTTVGGRYNQDQPLNGEITDLWIDINRAPDFTLAAEWEKFFAPTTHALQWKGNDGSVPYGTQPLIFMSGPIGIWHVNRGYGEGFTPGPSTVLAASTSPPAGAVVPQFALSDVAINVLSAANGGDPVVANEGSDNWPIAWCSDGNQVTSWGDGIAPDTARSSMGMARITAATYAAFRDASPGHTFSTLGATRNTIAAASRITFLATPPNVAPGTARGGKCYGLQAVPGGVLYALVGAQSDDDGNASGTQASEDQMENVTLIKGTNNGTTWTHIPAITWDTLALGKIWILPAALNMGRANGAAQDEYLYWYAAGARPGYTSDQTTDFAYGSKDIMLVRVLASAVETLASWQVFTGMSGSTPQWSGTFGNWAPVPAAPGETGWTLNNNTLASPNQANNQYPNVFYLPEFDEIILVRNTAARPSWGQGIDPEKRTDLEFWRSTSRKPWGPFALVKRFADWRPYDPTALPGPGPADAARNIFFFSVPPRWVPKSTGTTLKTISTEPGLHRTS